MFCVCALVIYLFISKNNRSFDTPVKGPPQGPRLHIDIPRVQLLIEDKEGIKQIGERKRKQQRELCSCVRACAFTLSLWHICNKHLEVFDLFVFYF